MAENEVKYFIDPVSHLVRRVIFDETWEFEDYKPIDGIMMPTKEVNVDRKSRINYTPQFAFNVEFEPTLFRRRPAIEDGPDGWKPSK